MGGLNVAFNTIQSALEADQEAINTTANNVANANTPGYTEESVTWQETDPISISGQQFGTGVEISNVTSQGSQILDQAIDQQQQTLSAATSREAGLTDIEDIFNQVATDSSSSGSGGIGGALTNFFSAITTLENSPAESASRTGFLSAAQALATSFNSAASQLSAQTNSLNLQVTSNVQQINGLTSSLATLNQQISAGGSGSDSATLDDQRQEDLTQLSALIGVNQIQTQDNGLTLTTTNGTVLVEGNQSFALSSGPSATQPGTEAVYSGTTDISTAIQGGSLGGTLSNLYTDIPAVQSQINTLAYSLATSVNSIQESGADENGNPTTGVPLFNITSSPTGAAAAISVAITDPSQIAAAAAGDGSADGSNAESMANLANQSVVDGSTPGDYYADFLAQLGSNVQSVQTAVSSVTTSLSQLTTQEATLSGVNQNTEAANLETYERAYQSASQTFTILNTLMGSALNLGVETAMSS
jgi:flagellar hook-associated protein 1 FlgK